MTKRTLVLPRSEERRQFPRYQIHHGKKPHLVAHVGPEWWPAHVLDLSKGGIGLLCDHGLDPGDVVALSLYHIPHRFVCERPIQIVLAVACKGAFLLGAAFAGELTDGEMARLL
jgi:hypothetical protein